MTEFFRLSGAGNDFVALVEPSEPPALATIRAWCRRGVSLGADGLFVLRREEGALRMDYFNADGDPAELCLNGTRCAARLAAELGWMDDAATIRTGAGPIAARLLEGDRAELELPRPGTAPRPVAVELDGVIHRGHFVVAGVPHFVLAWPEGLASAPVAALGPRLRHHPDFAPAGTNVDFVRRRGAHRIELRTFERGVEAETLACGTGILAAVAVGLADRSLTLPVAALTRGGFELEVSAGADESGWRLAGDARLVARGRILPGAERLPPPVDWS